MLKLRLILYHSTMRFNHLYSAHMETFRIKSFNGESKNRMQPWDKIGSIVHCFRHGWSRIYSYLTPLLCYFSYSKNLKKLIHNVMQINRHTIIYNIQCRLSLDIIHHIWSQNCMNKTSTNHALNLNFHGIKL
jgi:hypothetical protein